MQNFQEELKIKSSFEISGIVAIDGVPKRRKYPNSKEKLKITEHHFLWILNNPNLSSFSIFFYFYPIQNYRAFAENLLTIYNQDSFIKIALEEENRLSLKLGEENNSGQKIRVNNWNSFVLSIDLNKKSTLHINDSIQEVPVQKQLFDSFIKDKNFYAKFGDKEERSSFKGLIANFCILNSEISEDLPLQFCKKSLSLETKFDFSEPYILPFSKIEDFFTWTPNEPLNIATVPMKKVQRNPKKVKSLACHDMKGGYVEDSWLYGYNTNHYLLTIPPPVWTNICHQFGVLSLGVIITEGSGGVALNNQILQGHNNNPFFFADTLIDICKYYKFDGYLVNIESDVQDFNKLVKWVAYLTKKIHEVIPGSLIVWYESVIASGQVKWQSELNAQNDMFFDASDMFFTDYHWNIDKLRRSVQNARSETLKLFHGIDVWGRGAFAGGQYNTWQGCKACQDHNCSIALFGQAFTYEKSTSRETFILNDDKMWFGDNFVRLFIPRETKWYIELNKGQGWDVSYDEGMNSDIAVTSFELCVRSYSADLSVTGINIAKEHAVIEFHLMVQGTPPKVEDKWIAAIELYDSQNKFVASIDSHTKEISYNIQNFSQMMDQATAEWVSHCLTIDFSKMPMDIRNRVRFAKFIEAGQDIEYWAGHYGSRFCGEEMILKSNDPIKDMTRYLKTRRIMELPIHTYFNEGQGVHYWSDGVVQTKQPKVYNNLNDFDYIFPYRTKKITNFEGAPLIEPYFSTKICNNKAWNGGTSLELAGSLNQKYRTMIKLFKVNILVENDHELFIDLNVWGSTPKISIEMMLRMRNKKSLVMSMTKSIAMGDWTSMKFYYKFKNAPEANAIRGIFLSVFNDSNSKVDYRFRLGGFSCYDHLYKKKIEEIELKNSPMFLKTIQVKYNYKTIVKRKPNVKYFDLFIDMGVPEAIFNEIKYFRIYDLSNKWLLNTRQSYFQIENMKEEGLQDVGVKIQLVLNNGFHMKAENITPIIIDKSKIISLTSILE